MELMHLFHKNSIFIFIFCISSSATHKSYAQEHNGSGVFISTSPSLDPTLRKRRRAPHHSSSMLSKRRVTVQPVHQAGFSGEHGRNILSVARALSTSGGGVENIIRSHSYHGALQVEASLPPATQLMECSSCDDDAGLLACRVSMSTEEQLLFYAGRNLVASTTLSPECRRCTPPPAEMAPRLPMQCFRVASEMNVAVFACGHNTLCVCSPETSKEQLMHFTDHNIACMGPGRDGRGELTAMLDAHVVVVCGLMSRPLQSSLHLHESLRSSTLEGSCLSSATAERLTDFQVLVAGKLPSLPVASDAVPRQLVWGGHHLLWVLFSDGCVCALRLPEPASSSTTTSTEDDAHNSTSSVEQPTAMELIYHGNITPGEMMFVTADPCGLQLHYCSSHPSNTDLIHYGSIQLIQGASATTPARCTHYSTTCTDRIYGLRYDYGKYHLLTQSAKGQRPLYVTTLPRRSQPSDQTAACQNIMWGPADQLGQHCDALLAHAQKLSAAVHTFSSEEEVMGGLEELLEMQHSAYALLCRQHISMDRSGLPPSESTPNHMLNLISTKYTQLSVLLLFARLGALPLMRVPLNAALHATAAREASLATQAQLRQLMKQSYPAVGSSVDGVLEAQVWPDQATLCADRLTAAMGCSLGSQGDHLTLLQVVMRVEAITPDLSLLLMYCSYAMASTTVPQSVAEQLRQNFLEQFYQPSSTRVWASICFFADHGRVAAEDDDDDDDDHDKRDATFFGSHSMSVRAVVAAVRQLGNIPRMDLLPPLVHGLLRASAVDAIFFLVGPLLAQNEGSTLAPSLVMCILLVALLSSAPEVVVAIHDACRGTAMERMTTEALACAAIHGGSIAPLRGLVSVGSWQDEVVHEVLAQHPLAAARDRVRLPFLILTQRLEEAYHLAESMAVGGADATQQAHAVATHLRNLLSKATSESVDVHQPSTTSPAAAAQHATPAAAAAITPLDRREDEDEEERLRLMRGSGQLSTSSVVVRRGGAAANVSSVSGGLPMCGGVASAAVLRPSSLLASLDRGIQSMQHNTTLELSQAHHQPRASATTVSVAWPKRGEVVSVERSGAGEATSSMQLQHTTTTNFGENVVEQPARSRVVGGAPTMPRSFVGGEQRCEAVLKRSGTACGRLRPCPYHDRQS